MAIGLVLAAASGTSAASSPFIRQGEPLTAAGGDDFGASVALSQDGKTALVGEPQFNSHADPGEGAAWVFTRSGSTWSQQLPRFGPSDGMTEGQFGQSVALSADGNTALVGTNEEGAGGAAYVFYRSGAAWSETGLKLSGSAGADFDGGVALSGDGNTALVGGSGVWVLTRSGSSWTQGPELTTSHQGGVAIDYNGDTALVGGRIFDRSGSLWTEQTELHLGGSGALSANGDTALIGDQSDGNGLGAAWVFTRSGATWTPDGPKLIGREEIGPGEFGASVALSSDGATAVVGAPSDAESRGAAWVFTRRATRWQERQKLTNEGTGSGFDRFGASAALSADGNTALIGQPRQSVGDGTVWVFARRGRHGK